MSACQPSVIISREQPATLSTFAICIGAALISLLTLWLVQLRLGTLLKGAALVMGLPALLWAAAYARREPSWAMCALALMSFLIGFPLLNDQARLIVHYGLIALFCAPLLPAVWRSGIMRQGGFKLLGLYFAWGLATLFYSLAPLFSPARLGGSVLIFAAASLCAAQIDDRRDVDRWLGRFIVSFALLVALNLASIFLLPSSIAYGMGEGGGIATADNPFARFNGILGHPNAVGGLALMTVALSVLYWPSLGSRRKILLGLLAAGALVLGVMADSRSPIAALIIGGALFALWRYGFRAVPLLAGVAVGALVVFAAAGYAVNQYVTRGDLATLTGRTEMWQFVVEKIKERPLLGFGYEVAGVIFQDPRFPVWWGPYDEGAHSSLHNGYLSHAIGVGVPATLFWLVIFLRPWVVLLMRKEDPWRLKPAVFVLVIPLLIYNFSEAALGDFIDEAGLLFGMMWAVAERYRLLSARSLAADEFLLATNPLAAARGEAAATGRDLVFFPLTRH
jgi:exopolysaccharide production protein ExoQ